MKASSATAAALTLLLSSTFSISGALAQGPQESPAVNDAKPPPMKVVQTKGRTHFGIFTEKPAAPAPTLMIIAQNIDSMGADPTRFYTIAGRELAKHGWIYVVLDPACEGYLRQEGVPVGLSGWVHHARKGTDFVGPYVKGCIEVLDHLIEGGYTDPARVALSGTSRGAFCALHFAAAEPRIRVVTGVAPVTNPLALSEFAGVTPEQVANISIDSMIDRLAGRTVGLSIGNDDQRVNTDDCISLARKLVTAARRLKPDMKVFPVELIVGPSPGHRAIDDAYLIEAEFIRKQFR